jgi:hypothetical protein
LPLTDLRTTPFHAVKGAFYEAGAQFAHFAGSRL